MSELTFEDFLDSAGVPLEGGGMVSARTMRIVEIVRDYDSALEWEWIPREHRLPGDDPIRLVDPRAHGLGRVVMSFASEDDVDERVLERLFLADGRKHDVLAQLDARNAAARVVAAKRELDRRGEGLDLMRHALRSPLGRYSYVDANGVRKVLE